MKKAFVVGLLTIFGFLPNGYASVDTPFFYKISKNGKTSYLLGTIHLGISPEELPLPVQEQMAKAQILIAETKFDEDVIDSLLLHPADMIPIGKKETAGALSESAILRLLQRGIPESVARSMGDDACWTLIYSRYYFPKPLAMDFSIQKQAYLAKKEIVSLDTKEIREDAAKSSPASPGTCRISQVLAQSSDDQIDSISNREPNKYRFGLEAIFETGIPDRYTDLRTAAWIPKIEQHTQNGNALIIMGVAHLFGSKGVIALLKAEGYEIARYPFSN